MTATSTIVVDPRPLISSARQRGGLVPGVLLLGVIGYAGKVTEQTIAAYGRAHHLTLPNIEYVLWAIVFGLIVSNTIGVPKIFEAGIDTYEFWLKTGIVLLGVRFVLGDVAKLGGVSLVCVFVELVVSIVIMTALGRAFRLPPKLISLLSIGASVCGVSAIIAAKGAIEADDEDASYAIAAILALGAVSLVAFPIIGHALGMSDHAYGLWVGLAVDNTAEATAAGALYSDAAGKFAVLAKTARNATIGFVVLGYALYWVRRGGAAAIGDKTYVSVEQVSEVRARVPGHLDARDLRRILAIAIDRPREPIPLGVSVQFRRDRAPHQPAVLSNQGWRPLIVGVVGECAIAALTLGLVLGAARWLV